MLEEAGLFRKLASRPTCYLFLFNDVLVVTKKRRWAAGPCGGDWGGGDAGPRGPVVGTGGG